MKEDTLPDKKEPAVFHAINTHSPRSERQILTEGYQPQGSDKVPDFVPPLVSGVYFPKQEAAPIMVNEPSSANLPTPSPGKK